MKNHDVIQLNPSVNPGNNIPQSGMLGFTFTVGFIVVTSSPKHLVVNEHKFINSLKTLKPHGLDAVDTCDIIALLKF